MKKLFKSLILAVMLLLSVTLVGCGEKEDNEDPSKVTDQEVVDAAKGNLTINYTEVTTDFTLPTTAVGGVTVSWASNDAAIVINGQNAKVTRPAYEDGNKNVTLTATLAKGDASATKDFTVVVVCLEDVATIDAITVAEAIATEQGETVTVRGIVSGFHTSLYNDALSVQACYITDATGTVYVYGYLFAQEVEKGDDVVLTAKLGQYKGYVQLTEPTLVQTVSSENAIPTEGAITDKTVAQIAGDLTTNYTAAAYVFEGVQIKKITGSDYINYVVEAKDGASLNIYSGASGAEYGWLDEYLDKELNILYAVNGQNSAGTKWRGHVLEVLKVVGPWGGGSTATGTKETITNILAAASGLEHQQKLEGNYETTGVVTSIVEAYTSQYKNITFMLSDGTSEIECYRTKGAEAANVAVGDTVTVVGQVQKFYEKVEFAQATITARTAGSGSVDPKPEPSDTLTVAEAIASAQGATVTVKGVVSGFHNSLYNDALSVQACYLTDATGTIYVYGYQLAQSVQKGDEIIISATLGQYNGYVQLTSPNLVQKVASGQAISIEGAVTDKTVADIASDLTTNYTAAAYIFEGVQISKTVGDGYVSYVIVDAQDNVINVYSGANGQDLTWLDEYVDKEVKVLFAINSQNSSKTKWRGHVLEVLEVNGETPTPDPDPNPNPEPDPTPNPGENITATISEVLTLEAALAEGSTSTATYIITGVVVSISDAYNAQYENVSFYFSDGTSQMLVYRAKGDEAANVAKNDTVTLTGKIKNYYGNLQVVDATIDSRVEGEEVVVEGAVTVVIADYASANSWANSTKYTTINFDEFTTITVTGGQNTGKYYTNGNNWRIYQNESPALTFTSSKTILSVNIEYASQNTGTLTLNGSNVANAATVEVNANTVTFSVGNTGTATNGQARITSITIVYAD